MRGDFLEEGGLDTVGPLTFWHRHLHQQARIHKLSGSLLDRVRQLPFEDRVILLVSKHLPEVGRCEGGTGLKAHQDLPLQDLLV